MYRVHLPPDDNDTLLVTCPDLPEVTTFGEDEVDARLRAVDAIITSLQGRINHRREIPPPTSGKDGIEIPLGPLVESKVALYQVMRRDGVTKAELARKLGWHPPSVDRLFKLDHDSKMGQLNAAFAALGMTVHVVFGQAA